MMTTIVVVAPYSTIQNKSGKVTLYYGIYISAASANDFYSFGRQFVKGTLTHTSCQHYFNTHLAQLGCDTRLATTTLGRRMLNDVNNLFIIYSIYCVVVAMTKVVVHTTIFCRDCYFHIYI